MHAHDFLWVFSCSGDIGDGKRTGIGCKDCVFGGLGFDIGKDFLFE